VWLCIQGYRNYYYQITFLCICVCYYCCVWVLYDMFIAFTFVNGLLLKKWLLWRFWNFVLNTDLLGACSVWLHVKCYLIRKGFGLHTLSTLRLNMAVWLHGSLLNFSELNSVQRATKSLWGLYYCIWEILAGKILTNQCL